MKSKMNTLTEIYKLDTSGDYTKLYESQSTGGAVCILEGIGIPLRITAYYKHLWRLCVAGKYDTWRWFHNNEEP